MPVKLAPHQLAFYRELFRPFLDDQLSFTKRGGKELTYVDKRALSNRLDSMVGPHGWYPEYEATNRGYKCRLFILVPMSTPGTEVWMHKEDGAGFEEMGSVNKNTNEFECDVDNDEKSGYTNAFRRAAQDAWGIGRYLYKKGQPFFLTEDYDAWVANGYAFPGEQPQQPAAARPAAAPIVPADVAARAVAAAEAQPNVRPERDVAASAAKDPNEKPPAKQYDNFKIPRAGRSVFAWIKEMETVFETKLVDGIAADGEKSYGTRKTADWTQPQVDDLCGCLIDFVKTLPTYRGQFDHLAPAGKPTETLSPAALDHSLIKASADLPALKADLINRIKGLLKAQTGAEPTNAEVAATYKKVAADTPNAGGELNLDPGTLAALQDHVWIGEMVKFVQVQIQRHASAPPKAKDDDSIPF